MKFSVEVHHGGVFYGSGQNRAYIDGKVDWWDHVDAWSWSYFWVEEIVMKLGYGLNPSNLTVYWLLTGKDLSDGLRYLSTDDDTRVMSRVADKVKNFVIYFNHAPTGKDNEDDPIFMDDEDDPFVMDNDSDVQQGDDPDFMDSDNDVQEGDDDLFVDSVDEGVVNPVAVKDKSKKAIGSRMGKGNAIVVSQPQSTDEESDDELELPEDEDGANGVRLKFKSFVPDDLNNPTFRLGMTFPSVEMVRKVVTEYSLKHRVDIKMPRNDRMRISAHCALGCPWTLYCSWDSRVKTFLVKKYVAEHNCRREWDLKRCTAKWLAEKYIESFRADEKMTLGNFSRTVQKEWNFTPTRSKLWRARRLALETIYGDELGQYNKLWDYGNEILRSNPGSTFYLKLLDGHFSHLYMSLDACKRGFLSGCRPVIFLDGCHLKTKFGGILLTAVGVDPNDCIFPISMAVVEVESLATWKWFLETLKKDLNIDNTYPWTIMTDKQKVCNQCIDLCNILSYVGFLFM
jgi:hypothetical protein